MKHAVLLLALAACKDNPKQEPKPFEHPPIADAMVDAPVDWNACGAAIKAAAGAPIADRASLVIAGCAVCGDWKPLLEWDVLPAEGGPTRLVLDTALSRCNAICDGAAARRVAAVLDKVRGTDSHAPWRVLGEACKDKVNAAPDIRYMSAPYFALDRIARTTVPRDGIELELALPAVTVSGIGVTLPDGITAVHDAGTHAISIIGPEIRIGTLPRGKLTSGGVTIAGDYPGAVADKDLDAAKKLDGALAVIAPKQLPAAKLVEVVAKLPQQIVLDPGRPTGQAIELAVAAPSSPRGWQVPVTIPVSLNGTGGAADVHRIEVDAKGVTDRGKPGHDGRPVVVEVTATATVEDLAKALAALHDIKVVTLVKAAK